MNIINNILKIIKNDCCDDTEDEFRLMVESYIYDMYEYEKIQVLNEYGLDNAIKATCVGYGNDLTIDNLVMNVLFKYF